MPVTNNNQSDDRRTIMRYVSLITQTGAVMAAAILGGFALGFFADKQFKTEPYLLLAGIGLGIAAGLYKAYTSIIKLIEEDEKNNP